MASRVAALGEVEEGRSWSSTARQQRIGEVSRIGGAQQRSREERRGVMGFGQEQGGSGGVGRMALRWPGSGAARCRCGARWVTRIRVDQAGVGGGAPADWEVALRREGRRPCGRKCGGDAGQREEARWSQGRRREVSG